jgi:phosphatidylinositol 4-phosphatase
MSQVNWPKLNVPPWATEGYQESLQHAMKTPVLGSFIKGHERGKSESRVGFMEEGKKRVE